MAAGAGQVLLPLNLPAGFDPLSLHELNPARYPFLLESVASGTPQGRYDILPAWPGAVIELRPDGSLLGGPPGSVGFLAAMDRLTAQGASRSGAAPDRTVPFRGGWFLFLAYELLAEIEPRVPADPVPGLPLALAVRCPLGFVRDRQAGTAWAVAEPGYERLLPALQADLEAALARPAPAPGPDYLVTGLTEPDPGDFLRAVARARDHIGAGDIFQANLSRQWQGRLRPGVTGAMLYRRLRASNPAPFAGLAAFRDLLLVSSSPERLVRVAGDRIETRPIAGTRPRGAGAATEQRNRTELLASPKERAEHVMLIDLERNDLGRVCVPGTVRLDEFMGLETYSHVHHIVSNVSGDLRPTATAGEIIRAVFPGGTITGAPKVRCMELIRELEGRPRGAYTGAMGYLNSDGDLDLSILIRTIVVQSDQISCAAGSGIVADSEPEQELEETRAKARGMLLALEPAT